MTEIERVLVAGATGRTGRELLAVLRDTDLDVRALTRSGDADTENDLRSRGADEVVVGDLLDPADAARAVADCDAVVCAVGAGPSVDAVLGRAIVDGEGVTNLVDAAAAADAAQFVFESSLGVGDARDQMPWFARLLLRPLLRAKNTAEAALRTSGVPYTVVRPGGLTTEPPTGDVLVGEGGATVSGSIPRADVARVMVAALFTPDAKNRTFEVVSRDGLRGRARGLVDIDWQRPARREPAVSER